MIVNTDGLIEYVYVQSGAAGYVPAGVCQYCGQPMHRRAVPGVGGITSHARSGDFARCTKARMEART